MYRRGIVKMKVFITGVTGYVGRPVAEAILEAGYEVRCLVRTNSSRSFSESDLEFVEGDITDNESLRGKMDGCDVLVHLVGIIKEIPQKNVTMKRIHVDGTRNIIEEAKRAGIKRILHMSALGARGNAFSRYHQSKWEAEQLVVDSGLNYTIFRPSVIFGRGGPGPNFIAQMIDLIKTAPVIPVIGDGSFLLQPVSVQTIAQGFVAALEQPIADHNRYEVGGPEQRSYLRIIEDIAIAMNKKLRTVRIPVKVMVTLVPFLQKLPGFPLTDNQLQMLLEGNICENSSRFYEELGMIQEPFKVKITDYR